MSKWAIATPVYYSNPGAGYLQPKDYLWGIDSRFGEYESRADAARAYFIDHSNCSDQLVLKHYQRIYQNMHSLKIVKIGSLPKLEDVRAAVRMKQTKENQST